MQGNYGRYCTVPLPYGIVKRKYQGRKAVIMQQRKLNSARKKRPPTALFYGPVKNMDKAGGKA